MDRTIKEIADALQVSKQAIRQRINKLPKDCYYVGNNNTIYVTEEGFNLLKEKVSTHTTKIDSKVDASIEALIKQLDIKDKQIAELQKILNQEQQLNAMNQQKLQLLEDKQNKRKWFWQKGE